MATETHWGAALVPVVQPSTASCGTHASLANSPADIPAARSSASNAAAVSELAWGGRAVTLWDCKAEMRASMASSIAKVVSDVAHLFPITGEGFD